MKLQYLTDRSVLPVGGGSKVCLLVEIDSSEGGARGARARLNVCLVLDRSELMLGKKMYYVKQAARSLVSKLLPSDTISIVTYSDYAKTVVKPQPVKRKQKILAVLENLKASGRTNLSAGWLKGCKLVEATVSANTVNRVLLMSDGFANEGIRDSAELAALAQKKRHRHVLTTTLGFGDAFDEDLLVAIANAGGGNFHYIAAPEDVLPVFAEEVTGLTYLVADELSVCLRLSPDVQLVRQLNEYDMTTQDRTTRTALGGIFCDEKKRALFELMVPPALVAGKRRIAEVWLEYVALGDEGAGAVQFGGRWPRATEPVTVEISYASEGVVEAAVVNKVVAQEMALMQVATAIAEAKQKVNESDLDGASAVLAQIRKFLRTCEFPQQKERDLKQLLSHFTEELRLREDPARMKKMMTTTLFNLRRGRLLTG